MRRLGRKTVAAALKAPAGTTIHRCPFVFLLAIVVAGGSGPPKVRGGRSVWGRGPPAFSERRRQPPAAVGLRPAAFVLRSQPGAYVLPRPHPAGAEVFFSHISASWGARAAVVAGLRVTRQLAEGWERGLASNKAAGAPAGGSSQQPVAAR
ncbi:hypothetical protein TraAM80_08772 [Trypanosoma rangeli]|uniref:Uncharacterized protein n=1 Tax=Trypanosoma rangeli TaxID=5698 RepID=A0A3R7JXR3_TRYRA|nr:uncharacterized protein TraAM80_08772 [Trypanosoma rangeli]RNE98545.1 hypothetical protein TraAM80_08772 [Trypanosoma rangeli]|eukprot:RNE98545.1 hypothetical protein TraAM80_08772 [Trypanosoma rangeli]